MTALCVLSSTRERELRAAGADPAAGRQQFSARIDRLLSRLNIHLDANIPSHLRNGNEDQLGTVLLDAVQHHKGPTACALVVIGQSATTVELFPETGGAGEVICRENLRLIDRRCSELGIATEAFGTILLSLQRDVNMLNGVSRLLVRLSKPLRVLLMSPDPRDEARLRLGEERREMEDAILRTRFRGSLELHDVASCRVRDIASTLDRYDPNILHFSGHGDNSELVFENDRGEAIAVNKVALANLLGSQENLKLVILNACYSRDQAQPIADKVGYVVGMEGSILDEDSIAFSREFYAALGHGRTFEAAFERAKLVMALTTTMEPHLLKRTLSTSLSSHFPETTISASRPQDNILDDQDILDNESNLDWLYDHDDILNDFDKPLPSFIDSAPMPEEPLH